MSRRDVPVQEGLMAGLLAMALVLFVPFILCVPLMRDQGIFAWIGMTILHGGLPYADAWDVKGPAAGFTYAAALGLFGLRAWAVHLVDVVLMLTALALVWRFIRAQGGTAAWAHTACLLLLATLRLRDWEISQPDVWAGWLLIILLALLLDARTRTAQWVWFLAGLICGWMALLKPTYGLLALPLFTYAVHQKRGLIFALSSALLPALLLLTYALRGELAALWEVQGIYNIAVHSHLARVAVGFGPFVLVWFDSLSNFNFANFWPVVVWLATHALNLLVVLACFALMPLIKRARAEGLLLAGLLVTMTLNVMLQGKYYNYQLVPLYLLAGFVYVRAPSAHPLAQRLRPWGLSVFLVILLLAPVAQAGALLTSLAQGQRLTALYQEPKDGYSDAATQDAAAYLHAHSRADDPVYLWGYDAGLYFYAGRLPPTRLGFYQPMATGAEVDQARYREELLRDLARTPPVLLVVEKQPANSIVAKGAQELLREFAALNHLLESAYTPVYENAAYVIYQQMR